MQLAELEVPLPVLHQFRWETRASQAHLTPAAYLARQEARVELQVSLMVFFPLCYPNRLTQRAAYPVSSFLLFSPS